MIARGIAYLLQTQLGLSDISLIDSNIKPNHDNTSGDTIYILNIEVGIADCNGFDLIEYINKHEKSAKIIVFTMHEEPWIKAKLHTLDIDGAVSKNEAADEIIKAIKAIAKGEKYFSPAFSFRHSLDAVTPPTLSQREREVLKMLCKGLTSDEIADQLHISANTVNTYRRRLMEKLNVTNVAELIYQTKGLI